LRLTRAGEVLSEADWPNASSARFDGWLEADVREQMNNWPDEIKREALEHLNRQAYFSYLQELQARPYFLADDRNIYSDELEAGGRNKRAVRAAAVDASYFAAGAGAVRTPVPSPETAQGLVAQELETSLRRATEMLTQMTLGATATGSASANSVYLDVIRRLGGGTENRVESTEDTVPQIIAEVRALGRRSRDFEYLTLVPRFGSDDFVAALEALPAERAPIAEEVLDPFVASLSARLDALQDAQSLIRTFLDETNGFLEDKELTFTSHRGLRIRLPEGAVLNPAQLSSGERQVVLLLCNALLGRRGTRLFLIDEPELSLNAKWQRKIVPALLACTSGSSVQFIIATHSLELLSSYRSNVVTFKELEIESL
jgi:hypothetical protein